MAEINQTKNIESELARPSSASASATTPSTAPVERKKNTAAATGKRKLTPHPLNANMIISAKEVSHFSGFWTKKSLDSSSISIGLVSHGYHRIQIVYFGRTVGRYQFVHLEGRKVKKNAAPAALLQKYIFVPKL